MQPSTLAKRLWFLLFVVIGVSYLYGLGHFPFVGPDEPRYAEVAREMFLRHDLVTPTLGGHPWFEKPALLYWMMIAGFSIFGISEGAARLGPAISGLLTVVAIYWLARRIEIEQTRETVPVSDHPHQSFGRARFSALVAASSGGLIAFSRGASFDILITMSITFALGCFLASELVKTKKERRWLLAGFWCSMGLSLLAKGLVGIVIPVGVVAAYFCLRRRWPDRLGMVSAVWGMPLALLVSAVWYGPVIFRNGWPFIDQFFIQHHFARYLSNKYHHPQPIYFYLPVILALCLPWTAFVIEAVVRGCKPVVWSERSDKVESKTMIFLIVWLIFPLAFFSLSGSKLPGYVLPALPAAALLAGERLWVFVRQAGSTITMRSTGLVLLTLSPTGAFYAMHFGNVSMKCAALVVAPLLLAGAVATFLAQMRKPAAVMIVIAILAAVQLSLGCAAPRFTERETVRELIRSADQLGYKSAPLFMFEKVERTAEFYAAGRVAYGLDGEPVRFELVSQVVQQAGQTPGPILIILRPRAVSLFTNLKNLKTREIGTNGATSLIAVERQ